MNTPTQSASFVSVEEVLETCYRWITKPFEGRYWQVKLLLVSVIMAFCMQVPRYKFLHRVAIAKTEVHEIYNVYVKQINEPFKLHNSDPDSHESKMVFRLTVPLLMRALRLPPVAVFIVQFFVGVLMTVLSIRLIYKTVNDRTITLMLVLGMSCIYFGCAYLTDVYAMFDAFSYAILIATMLSLNPYMLCGLVVVGGFNDERTIIALPLVVLWQIWRDRDLLRDYSVREFLADTIANRAVWGITAGVVLYLAIRLILAHHFDLVTHGGYVGPGVIVLNAFRFTIGVGLLSGLESFWSFVLAFVLLCVSRKSYLVMSLLLLSIIPISFGALMVGDVTRSIAYIAPVFILCLSQIKYHIHLKNLRHLSAGVMLGAMIIPTTYITGGWNLSGSIVSAALTVFFGSGVHK